MNDEQHTLQARLAAAEAEVARLTARERERVGSPTEAADAIRALCENEQETFVVLLMNARQQILHSERVAVGSVAKVGVHPRDVFRAAVRMNAHSIIVGHNHPSENATPSDADLELTARLSRAGQILGIPVLDHVVVTTYGSVSFASSGLL